MGGSDQWGNITSGTEFIRRNINGKSYGVTTPLLTKSDGSKFGKSESGNLWIDGEMTSPYKFYQFWINADDRDLPKYFRYFSYKDQEAIESLEAKHSDDPRLLKAILAEELTKRIHSESAHEAVQKVSTLLFSKSADANYVRGLSEQALDMVAGEIPTFEIPADQIKNGCPVIDLITDHSNVMSSKGEARRAIKGNALSVNRNKIGDHEQMIVQTDLLHGKFILVENGKKNKFLLIAR
jgi:tyrosyl-tRNA synthetase